MLDERVHWHCKKSAEESEQAEMQRSGLQRVARVVKQRAENRHANRANRNQPVLNLSSRKIAGREAAHADADSNRRL